MDLKTPITVSQAAELLGITFRGDGSQEIKGINEIHRVRPGDLTFVDVAKYYKKALTSAATIILINKDDVEIPEGKSLLISQDPFSDYNKLVAHFMQKEVSYPVNGQAAPGTSIDPTAVIYPGVVIGRDVTIGKNTVIYPNVVIYDNAVIGNNVTIHANAVIGGHAYYYKTRPDKYEKMISCGRVVIHDNVEIGPCCTIAKGVSADTIIGEGTKLDSHVHIGHDVEIGRMCLLASQVGIAGASILEDNVIVWGQVGITKDVRIGTKAVISAQSGVSKSLEGGKAYFGSPAQEILKVQREMAWLRQQAAAHSEGKKEE